MKKIWFMANFLVALSVFAAPTVTDVVAKQRFPWNGLVDITCKVMGIDNNSLYRFYIEMVMPDLGKTNKISKIWLMKDGVKKTLRNITSDGCYHFIWDAKAELGEIRCTNMIVSAILKLDAVQLWENGHYWATTNIGAEEPWESGYSFWWGDTVGYRYESENYAWVASDGSSVNFRFHADNTPTYGKSISDLKNEGWITPDNILVPEHDAANIHWGAGFRLPTIEELNELTNNCDWVWTSTNGVNGYIVRGRGAYAISSIFLPADHYGSAGYYQSSVPVDYRYEGWLFHESWALYFYSDSGLRTIEALREYDHFIRPVRGFKSYQIRFDANGGEGGATVLLTHGVMLGALPQVTRSGYTFDGWWTAVDGGARISSHTLVTGEVIYYARWLKDDSHEKVQLWEGGPFWATTNIGAEKPWEYGYYFWWGDTIGYKRESGEYYWVASDGSNSSFAFYPQYIPTYDKSISELREEGWITSDNVLMPKHDAAHVHWGCDWRMPTSSELSALKTNCDCAFTITNGVKGIIVRGRGAYSSNSIFLPAAGYGEKSYHTHMYGLSGHYWSSVPYDETLSYRFIFYSRDYDTLEEWYTTDVFRDDGGSVRPVQGFSK